MPKEHLYWIDWMKVIGIYFIVLGHLFPNGGAKMYDALYGKNIVLFFMGSLAGTVAIYIFSVLIQNKRPRFLGVISMGNIIILGLHPLFIRAYSIFIEPYKSVVLDYSVALFIVLAFVPIIILSKRFFPIMLGSRAHKDNNTIIFE